LREWCSSCSSSFPFGSFKSGALEFVACTALALAAGSASAAPVVVKHESIDLELRPRVCTLSAKDDFCDTVVQAQWHSKQDESLCLVIVGRPEVRRCWERYSQGVYTVELAFSEDLIVELRDPQLQNVLVSAAVTVIKEALLRRKRRQPWNIF
jgi:hypothetical protein